ncbi:hypothetical protein V8E36_008189 [Tilletia maclaganii]
MASAPTLPHSQPIPPAESLRRIPTMPCDNCSCAPAPAAAAVPLPSRQGAATYGSTPTTTTESTPLLWSTTTPASTDDSCDRHHLVNNGNQCCKTLNSQAASSASSSTHLLDPDTIRDIIIGLSDGLSVPFALAAGLTGFGSSRIVVLGGIAELVAGAISMGVGGYLSASAEMDHFRNQAASVHERVSRSCLPELTREVASILEPFGLGTDVAEKVAERLARVEQEESSSTTQQLPLPAVAASGPAPAPAGSTHEEQGLTPFLLKVGHGLEPISPSRAYISAATIGLSYFLGGLVPLIPYMVWPRVSEALLVSIAVTGLVLLLFGAFKHKFTGGTHSVRAYTWAAFSTLAVGGIAAAASWGIVRAIQGHE